MKKFAAIAFSSFCISLFAMALMGGGPVQPPTENEPPLLPKIVNREPGKAVQFVAFEQPGPSPKKGHGRGRKVDPVKTAAFHAAALARHGHRMRNLSKTTLPAFDCRTAFNNVLPVDDQGSCGDCFGVSSADAASMCLVKAGYGGGKADGSFRLSSQFGLDCGAFQGGCGGGDEAQVIDYIKTTGFPLTSDYGAYTANPGKCKDSGQLTRYKIADWGYCTPSQQEGVASVQDMKDAMVRYGPLSVAFDASECNGYVWPGTMTGHGGSVDHAVINIAWDDGHDNGDGSKGAFLGMNQWGDWGGPGGTFWIKYGADSWGTEAIWVSATALPPPPGPTPPPPGPTPPPPVPGTTPTMTLNGTGTVYDGVTKELSNAGLNSLVAQMAALNGYVTPTPPPVVPPSPCDAQVKELQKQLADQSAATSKLADQVIQLQKLIQGGNK